MKATAGLPLSVGQAPLGLRIVIAAIFLATSAILLLGARMIPRAVAVLFVAPIGWIGVVASAFILAPHSRFGAWLDPFVPRLREPRVAIATAIILWLAAFASTS